MAKKIKLTNKNDTFDAGGGKDYVLGLDGNDKIDGGKGNDTLVGGKGNDKLTSKSGQRHSRRRQGQRHRDHRRQLRRRDDHQERQGVHDRDRRSHHQGKDIETFKFDDRTLTADQMNNDAPTGTATAALSAGTEDTSYTVNASDLIQGFSTPIAIRCPFSASPPPAARRSSITATAPTPSPRPQTSTVRSP